MANFCGSDNVVWSEEHDSVPLKQRLKLLLASQCILECQNFNSSVMLNGVVVKKEYDQCDLQDLHCHCSSKKGKNGSLTEEQNPAGETEAEKYMSPNQLSASEMTNANYSSPHLPSMLSNFPVKVKVEQADGCAFSTLGNIVNSSSVTDKYVSPNNLSAPEMINANDGFSHLPSTLSNCPAKVKVKQADDSTVSTLGNSGCGSSVTVVQPIVKLKTGTSDDILDDHDHVVLKDRQRLLLSRCYTGIEPPLLNKNSSYTKTCNKKVSSSTTEVMQVNSSHFCNKEIDNTGQEITAIGECGSYVDDKVHHLAGNVDWIWSSENTLSKREQSGGSEPSSGGSKTMFGSGTELVNVKIEPTDNMELERKGRDSVGRLTFSNVVQVKTEFEVPYDSCEDKLDHMILRERMKLLSSKDLRPLSICGNSESSSKVVPLALDSQPMASEYAKPLKIYRPRKRRKTATDSVGTALEEDAPGLLQVLVEKGVSVDEMKLYGQTEFDGALDELSSEDSFSELEAVISKLFSHRTSLLKFAPLRCSKGEKTSYCLACLFSLVEQARYLRFRNWPVEWGWCRDLQSFVFVFERHNRIVLERPEYGYATYFFELVDSLSVDWQIKRLVTAMKLSSCSRVNLIENRALEIGEDLTEGEARVLMEYGWIPNSGLATMLNYRDRVVHDRKSEKDISDWRTKIGKLLMDGYNGGTIVPPDIPIKLAEYTVNRNPQIKLELS